MVGVMRYAALRAAVITWMVWLPLYLWHCLG
jgi:hypothetical protein